MVRKRVSKVTSTVAFCLYVLTSSVVFSQGVRGVDFSKELVPIVEDVYVFEGALQLPGEVEPVRTNSLVVFDEAGIVVVDGQDTIEEGEHLIAAIRARSSAPIRYLITASPHGDHIHAHRLFEGTTIVGQSGTTDAMAAQRSDEFEPVLPDLTFDNHMKIVVGTKTIELYFFGPAHTPADTIVHLPESGVVFLSEVYFNNVFPSLFEGFAVSHLEVLDKAAKLKAEWFVPGHGVVSGADRQALRRGMQEYRVQVQAILTMVKSHVDAGDTLEQTLAVADDELAQFADVPFFGFLKERSIRGTYLALSGADPGDR